MYALLGPALLALALSGQDSRPVIDEGLTQAELEAMTAAILEDIEALRGAEYTREVKVSIADHEGFLSYVDERIDRMTTPDKLRAEELALKVFGLIEPDMDYMATQMEILESQVGGFYDPATESFCLMDSFQGGLAKIILAHELTHALDDQLYDIDGTLDRLDGNADAQLAYQAVVEGSGTGLMNRWMIGNLGKEVSMEDLQGAEVMDTASLEDAPACMWKPLMMVYLRGASFLCRSDNVMVGQMGNIADEDLHRAFTAPPRSSEQVLHPEKYWDADRRDEPTPVRLDTSRLEAAGWKLLHTETLGEAQLALVTSPMDERGGLDASNPMALLGMRYTNRAAEGWDGDRYTMLEKDGALLFYFASVWDSEQDQEQFVANLGDQARFLSTSRQALASHLAGEDEGSLQQWSAALGTWSHTALLFNGGDLGLADLVADVDVLAPIAR
mgnify:CR=1 FL=1